jgi:sulfhydrogenase subunit beta (sulfur reductase)
MQKRSMTYKNLENWLAKLIQSGRVVHAPQKNGTRVNFKPLRATTDLTLDYIQTVDSAKSVFFPRVEQLMSYNVQGQDTQMLDRDLDSIPNAVLFGARPCDAAAIGSMKAVFSTDYQDALFMKRLEKTTVIGLSCANKDSECFCTSVGVSPGATAGSDILLTRLGDGDFLVEILTPKGEALTADFSDLFAAELDVKKEDFLASVEPVFDTAVLEQKLAKAFGHELWDEASLRCLGCGACTFVCPVCSCFDIQDEGTHSKGQRLRCWDSCGFSLFTLHTSGHNPRHSQNERWRQRMLHKFSYMPERLQVLGCVGCGRCSRACSVDMNLLEQVKDVYAALS